jgi:hypothetical protein
MNSALFILFACAIGHLQAQKIDTLSVNLMDTSIFITHFSWIQRPCQKPEWNIRHEMKAPQAGTYYLIYNALGQLTQEGLFTSDSIREDNICRGFCNTIYYYYKKNGKIRQANYHSDGRNVKIAYYRRGKLKEIKMTN